MSVSGGRTAGERENTFKVRCRHRIEFSVAVEKEKRKGD
jgi:hypothetical protein